MLLGRGQSGDHSEEHAELFRMDPVQAGEGWAGRAKAGLQSATVRCLAARTDHFSLSNVIKRGPRLHTAIYIAPLINIIGKPGRRTGRCGLTRAGWTGPCVSEASSSVVAARRGRQCVHGPWRVGTLR